MSSQTTQVARSVRLSQWMEQIRDCQNRSHDVSVVDWCRSAGISKNAYYYRLKRVREGLLESMTNSVPVHENRIVPVPAALMCSGPNSPGTTGDSDLMNTSTTCWRRYPVTRCTVIPHIWKI